MSLIKYHITYLSDFTLNISSYLAKTKKCSEKFKCYHKTLKIVNFHKVYTLKPPRQGTLFRKEGDISSLDISVCDEQHPRAGQNTQQKSRKS